MSGPLLRHVEFLREAAQAPDNQLGHFVRALDTLPRIFTSEAGPVAIILAHHAKGFVRQMPQTSSDSLRALRDVVARAADALEAEARLHPPMNEEKQPYYLDR